MLIIAYIFFAIGLAAPVFAQAHETLQPVLFPLNGIYTHPISSKSSLAQKYFDQGMVFFYGYNFGESARSFQEAAGLDPECAICYWGKALALRGDMDSSKDIPLSFESIQKSKELILKATPQEQAYINALADSYLQNVDSLQNLDSAFMREMKKVSERYPEDLDAEVLYAKAKMDISASLEREDVKGIFLGILAKDPNHPGANHFYIHAIDASSHPEDGLASAKRLEYLIPFAGHLLHMPAHVYYKMGLYHKATLVNEKAIKADEDLFAKGGIKDKYFSGFYLHNHLFLIASLVMEGKNNEALQAEQRIMDIIKNEKPTLSIFYKNALTAQRILILQRFNAWDQILKEPKPGSPLGNGMWHFAKSLAYLSNNELEKAKTEAAKIQEEHIEEQENALNILLRIAFLNAQAAIEEKEGNQSKMLEDYQEAIRLEDGIATQFEPSFLFFSSREALGYAFLRSGKTQDAEKMFQEDLKKHPNKIWSLNGLLK